VSRTEQAIADLWAEMEKESVGAAELAEIQQRLLERFGLQGRESPAAIARILANTGARLKHPEILEADVRWREREAFSHFTPEELNFSSIDAALVWIEKLSALAQTSESRGFGLQLKAELELVATSRQIPLADRLIAAEIAQWLTVWLQNPAIFSDWLALRRESEEFQDRFSHKEAQETQKELEPEGI
jgi:hypothetical protein